MPAADGEFVPLAQLLRAGLATDVVLDVAAPLPPAAPVSEPVPLPEIAGLARDVRVFRACLADAFEAAAAALLREFACAVLGRELVLAPPDIAAIAVRVLAAHPSVQPLRLRVAPSDVAELTRCAGVLPPIASDAELAPGDAILEFAGGLVDARLGIRLAALLESVS